MSLTVVTGSHAFVCGLRLFRGLQGKLCASRVDIEEEPRVTLLGLTSRPEVMARPPTRMKRRGPPRASRSGLPPVPRYAVCSKMFMLAGMILLKLLIAGTTSVIPSSLGSSWLVGACARWVPEP